MSTIEVNASAYSSSGIIGALCFGGVIILIVVVVIIMNRNK